MAELAIRPLTLADRVCWAALRHALWPENPAAKLGDELADMLKGDFQGFGAFIKDVLVGFAEISQRPYGDGCDTAPVAWLEGIYVLPAHRRQGVGRRLLTAAEQWARERGLTELGSDAELDNLTSRLSHAFWGFSETERIVRFRKALQ
jgi:aminoglycoside 6'-N-acetyltransferase I